MPSWITGRSSATVQIFFGSSSHFSFWGIFAAAKSSTLHLERSSQVTNHGSRQTRNMARPSRCYSLDPPPSYRGSPKDDFSLEPTRPSTWLIAETDSSRTGTRNSCSANDGLKQFCPHTKFSANKKLSSCFNTGSFCIDSASFPVFRSQLFGEY